MVFHENSTLSYTAARRIEFLEDQNEPGILNRTILVPNFVVLVGFWRPFILSPIFKLNIFYCIQASAASINGDSIQTFFFEERLNEPLFLNITIYDYLWRYESDFIKTLYNMNVFGINIGQFFVPTNNSGVLYQVKNHKIPSQNQYSFENPFFVAIFFSFRFTKILMIVTMFVLVLAIRVIISSK